MTTLIEKKAIGIVTNILLGVPDKYVSSEDWYGAYLLFKKVLDNDDDPEQFGFYIWEPLKEQRWDHLLHYIEEYKSVVEKEILKAFSLAKKGIVQSSINMTLDEDLNSLDLEYMMGQGLALDEK